MFRSCKKDGKSLAYVKEQSNSICLEAVKENYSALSCVKEQTEEICIEAVKQNDFALYYVNEQTEKNMYGSSKKKLYGSTVCK